MWRWRRRPVIVLRHVGGNGWVNSGGAPLGAKVLKVALELHLRVGMAIRGETVLERGRKVRGGVRIGGDVAVKGGYRQGGAGGASERRRACGRLGRR